MAQMRLSSGPGGAKKKSSVGLSGFNQQLAKIPKFVPPVVPQFNYTQPTAPAYQGLPAAPAYQAQQPAYQQGPSAGFSPGAGAPGGSFAAPAPPRMSEADWLKGDAEFNAQQNEYNRALELFKSRINKKKTAFEDDYKESSRVTGLNKQQTMTGVGEDFAARGMAYSGLFDSARTDTENVFKRQLGNLETVRNRSKSQADDDLADYQQEIDLSRGNAKRNALARFANQQSLF